MIVSKNSSGFTLIEALLAIAIIGIVLMPIYALQGTILDLVVRQADHLSRILTASGFLKAKAFTATGKELKEEKKIEQPEMLMQFEQEKVSKDSPFKKLENLYVQSVNFSWKRGRVAKKDKLVTLAYLEKDDEKKK